MNIIGKMLIVMIFGFSLLSMCFAGAVYSVGASWKAKAEDFEGRLATADQNYEDTKAARDSEVKTLADELKKATDTRDEAVAELATQAQTSEQTRQLRATARAEADKAIADGEVAATEAAARVAEAATLNKELQALRTRNSELNKQIQTSEDQILELRGQNTALVEKEEALLSQIGRLRVGIVALGEDPDALSRVVADADDIAKEKIDGVVKVTEMTTNQTQQLLEISVGSDDKVFEEMSVTVYSGKKFLAKARVIKVFPDYAHCIVDEASRNGRRIVRGDLVTTKF